MSDAEEMDVTLNVTATGQSARPYSFTAPAAVFHDVLMRMNEVGDAGVRRSVSKDLSAECDIDKLEDNEEVITITPTKKAAPELAEALGFLGLEVDLDSIPVPEKEARTPRERKSKEPTYCLFSGELTSGGPFRPGHDMKLKGALLKVIDNAELEDDDTVTVGTGTAATEYTVEQAIEKLLSFENWHYTEEGLRERRGKALQSVADKAAAREAREQAAAEKKAAKNAPVAEAA